MTVRVQIRMWSPKSNVTDRSRVVSSEKTPW